MPSQVVLTNEEIGRKLAAAYAPILPDLLEAERIYRAELASRFPFVQQLVDHCADFRGKRLRPALVLLGRLPMGVAVGTSLLVIAMKSTAGFAGYLASTPIQWPLALTVAAVAVLGSVGGARLAGVIPGDALRRGFGWFVVVMAVFILGQEVPKAMGIPVTVGTHWPYLLTAMAIPPAAAALVAWIRRHRAPAAA